MSTLTDALFEFRIHALGRIARLKNIEADDDEVRSLARHMTDNQVLAELGRKRRPFARLLVWIGWRR